MVIYDKIKFYSGKYHNSYGLTKWNKGRVAYKSPEQVDEK